nr:hypothetical protein BaRGS_009877 [Batillaria attramentaria]
MECPVCHEEFSQPKILPCAHLLCRDCLVTWLKSEGDAECPLCRCAIVAASERGNKSCEEVADGLPTDLAMAALVDSARTLRDTHTCQACLNVPAVSICLNCGDLMCRSCSTIHHRACPEVTELEEKVKEAQAVLSELAAMLSAGESELERAMSELDQHLIQTEKNTQSALADIDAACDRLQKCVEACRRRLKELALAAKSDVAAAVNGGKSVLVERRGKLTSHKRLVERAKMTSPRSSVGDMSTTLKSRVNDLDRSTGLPANAKVITKATFIIDPQALARVEKELAELGKVDVVNASPQPPPVTVWRFHGNHGQNITLSNNQQTAERTRDYGYGVVVSCEQTVANRLYEVKMEQVDTRYTLSRYIFIGVMTVDPASHSCSSVVDAPELPSAYVMCDTHIQCPGKQQEESCSVGAALTSVGVGDRVGVLVDAARCLHLYVNGTDQGVAARDVPHPCYAFFDLSYYWKKAATIQTLQTSLATVDAHENKLQLQMTALNLLNNMLNTHDALIKQQAASLASLENSFQTEAASIQGQLDSHNGTLKRHEVDIRDLESRVNAGGQQGSSVEDLRLSVTRHQMSIQSLTGSVDRLGNRVTTLEANNTWLANRLSVQEREVGFRVEMGLNRQGQHYNVHIAMNTPIKYDKVLENHGNGYSDTTGKCRTNRKFTAPYAGIYWFYTHFMATEQGGVELAIFSSSLGGWGRACMASSEDHDIDSNDMSSCSAILRLRQGEEVYVSLNHGAPYIWSAYAYFDVRGASSQFKKLVKEGTMKVAAALSLITLLVSQIQGQGNQDVEATLQQHAAKLEQLQADLTAQQNQVTVLSAKVATLEAEKQVLSTRLSVQERAVAFHVDMGENPYGEIHITLDDPIVFERTLINVGDGFDNSTGVFTAPFRGLYSFTLYIMGGTGQHDDIEVFAKHNYGGQYLWGSLSTSFVGMLVAAE